MLVRKEYAMDFGSINPGKIERKRLLRWGLYVVLGIVLAQSAWVIGSQSIAHGRYFPVALLSFLIGTVAAIIYLERKYRGVKFQFYHPWRIPNLTTRGVLWLIAGFDALVMGAFFVIVMVLMGLALRETSVSTLLQLSALLVVATSPYGYWLMRRQYEPVPAGETVGDDKARLRYTGYSNPPWHQRLIWAVLFGALVVVFMNVFSSSL